MAFNSYEELKAAVEARRKSVLTLEVGMGTTYSQEHEDAKTELANAKAMRTVMGGGPFLGGDNTEQLQARVAETKPEDNSVYIQYSQLDLNEWSALTKMQGITPIEQYEKVLGKTFLGVYGVDPVQPDDWPADQEWTKPEPLTTDPSTVSTKGGNGILPGGGLYQVVQAFMAWQNSGGDVNIRPTRSGLV